MRLFAGIGLDREMRDALAFSASEARRLFPGRYAAADNYHVTLAFIGETEAAKVSVLRGVLLQAAAGAEPFSIALGKLAYFRRPQEAVLFCGLADAPPLARLALDVGQRLVKAGFLLDGGEFHPHITLARQARIDPGLLAQVPVASAGQRVTEITLFESRREGDRLRYVPLLNCELKQSGT